MRIRAHLLVPKKSNVFQKQVLLIDLPNAVAPVKPGALSITVHDELIVCE